MPWFSIMRGIGELRSLDKRRTDAGVGAVGGAEIDQQHTDLAADGRGYAPVHRPERLMWLRSARLSFIAYHRQWRRRLTCVLVLAAFHCALARATERGRASSLRALRSPEAGASPLLGTVPGAPEFQASEQTRRRRAPLLRKIKTLNAMDTPLSASAASNRCSTGPPGTPSSPQGAVFIRVGSSLCSYDSSPTDSFSFWSVRRCDRDPARLRTLAAAAFPISSRRTLLLPLLSIAWKEAPSAARAGGLKLRAAACGNISNCGGQP